MDEQVAVNEIKEQPKKKRGREKLPPELQQTKVLTIRLTEAQEASILAAAKADGMKASTWGREVLLEAAGTTPGEVVPHPVGSSGV